MSQASAYWGRRISRRAVLASGGAATLLVACGGSNKSGGTAKSSGTSAGTGQPKTGGTLRYHIAKEPGNLDPHLATDSSTTSFSDLAYNGLLRFKTGPSVDTLSTTIEGDLADKWETPDAQTVVLKLRQDVKWQNKPPLNGRAFTAEDAKWGILRIGTNKPEFQRATFFQGIDRIDVPDASTIVIKQKAPNVPFLTYLAVPYHKIISRDVIEKEGDAKITMIGTGPFTLESYASGGKATFKRNPDYFRKGYPYLDGVEITGVLESATRLAAFRAGETDVIIFQKPDEGDAIKKQVSAAQIEKFTPLSYNLAYGFDVTRPPFTDMRVRQAIALVIDHPGIRRALFQDEAVRHLPIPVGFKDWLADPKDLEFYSEKPDPAKAKQLLEAAGFTSGFKTVLDTNTAYSDNIELMPLLQQTLKQIGIEVTELKQLQPAAFLGPTNAPGGFVMRLWNHAPFSEPDEFVTNFYQKGASRNFGGWGSESMDALILKQRGVADKAERKKVLIDIQKELARTNWRIGMEQKYEVVGWYDRVKGFRPLAADGVAYYTQTFEQTWIER